MHFHQLPGDAAASGGLGANFENHCPVLVSAQGRKMLPELLHLKVNSFSHRERLTLVLLPTSWETKLTDPVGPSAMARHIAGWGPIVHFLGRRS